MGLWNKEKSERLRTLRTPDCISKVGVIATCFRPDVRRCRSTSLAIMDPFHPLKHTHPLASGQFMSGSSCWHVIRSERLFAEEEVLRFCFSWPLLRNRGHQVLQAMRRGFSLIPLTGSAASEASSFPFVAVVVCLKQNHGSVPIPRMPDVHPLTSKSANQIKTEQAAQRKGVSGESAKAF